MKIDLKLSPQQLNSLVYAFNSLPAIQPTNRETKVALSILDKVSIKFKKKHLEASATMKTLFTKPKKMNFSLEYYEAHCLEYFVTLMDSFPLNDYDRNVLRFIGTNLNQQLA